MQSVWYIYICVCDIRLSIGYTIYSFEQSRRRVYEPNKLRLRDWLKMMMRMLGAKFQTFYWSELFSNILLVIYFFFALLLPFPAAAMYEWMVFIELWSLYFLVKIQAILAQVVQQLTQTVCMFPPWLSNFLAWLDRHNNIVEQKTYQKKKTYKCTNVINVFSSTIWNNSKAMEMFSQIINTRLIWTSSSSNYSLIRCPYLALREDDQMIKSHPSTTLIHFFFSIMFTDLSAAFRNADHTSPWTSTICSHVEQWK